jgi:hypothetical protein
MSSQALQGLYRPGWLTFAAIVLFSVGCLRVISAIYYFADSARVNDLTLGAFGHHLFLWGIWDLIIALLALVRLRFTAARRPRHLRLVCDQRVEGPDRHDCLTLHQRVRLLRREVVLNVLNLTFPSGCTPSLFPSLELIRFRL